MLTSKSVSRRGFFSLFSGRESTPTNQVDQQTMPFVVDYDLFDNQCNQCMACAEVCPNKLVVLNSSGSVALDLEYGGCNRCGRCVDACADQLLSATVPFHLSFKPYFNGCSHPFDGCDMCIEECNQQALTIVAGKITLDDRFCDGCGECAQACLENYISMVNA